MDFVSQLQFGRRVPPIVIRPCLVVVAICDQTLIGHMVCAIRLILVSDLREHKTLISLVL